MWVLLALGSSLAFCFVSVCDKRLLSFHLNGVPPLCLWCGMSGLLYGSVLLAVVGVPAGMPWPAALAPVGAGLLLGCSVVLLFRGMRQMEASRAVAISQTNPIFVALLALLFLGERIAPAQWAAIGLVVAGAMLISLRLFPDSTYERIRALQSGPASAAVPRGIRARLAAGQGPLLLVLAALCAGSSFVVAKAALNAGMPVLTVYSMQQVTVGTVFFTVGLTGGPRLLAAARQPRVLAILFLGESLMPAVSILLSIYAYSVGPVSLVAAMLATRPLFVFIASTILSRVRWQLLDESLTPRALLVKGASIIMIVGGVSAISIV